MQKLNKKDIDLLFDRFNNLKVLIIGDIMLDAYIYGKVERISPEAPVPIVAVSRRENRLGGAANVALNVKALGAEPLLCGMTGNDDKAGEVRTALQSAGLSAEGIITSPKRKTTVKFRIIGNNTQLLRVDEESVNPIDSEEFLLLTSQIKKLIDKKKADVIIFQDYDKGVITPQLIDYVTSIASENGIPVAVDPKKRNFIHYRNVTLFKPNLKEIADGMNRAIDAKDLTTVEQAVTELQKKLEAKIVLNTLSENGMFALWNDNGTVKSWHTPAHVRKIADVSGAGDTVISVAALCLAANESPRVTVELANLAGGLVCEEVGVVPVNKERLINEAKRILSENNQI